jgi:UDP-N-acetylglucosamine--dolichyl-phosphate N-acetylglucosaminephosphotransferase
MPLFASLPLLMVYYVQFGLERTYIIIPVIFRGLASGEKLVKLGVLYYVYMAGLCVFCTNAVNILAGINGLEGGQALVLACSIVGFNVQQMAETGFASTREAHLNSIYFLVPFIGVCVGYLRWNWYPARVFGGDTFAYFSGLCVGLY